MRARGTMQSRMAGTRQPTSVQGLGFVLGRRHQIFILSVLWSDGSDSLIYRTLEEFRQFHKRLKNTFPLEAGLLKSSDRTLPKFQDTSALFPSGRTRRGLAKLQLLEAYSQKLLGASETVSQSEVVIGFFQPQPGDLEPVLPQNSLVVMPSPWEPWERLEQNPKKPLAPEPDIQTLEAQTYQCIDSFSTQDIKGRAFQAEAGEQLDVLLREPTGWWLVENEDKQVAWFPAPYLQELSPRKGCEEPAQLPFGGLPFCTSEAYESSREDELCVPAGARVTVLKVSERGWWQCRYRGRLGLLPAVLLRRCPGPANASGLALLNAGRTNPEPESDSGAEAEPGRSQPRERRLPPPVTPKYSSDSGSSSDNGEEASVSVPVVPARPRRGDILRSCCSVTRRALLGPETLRSRGQTSPGAPP
ncbi:NADPH oxidase organizer 1 [Antechinus flavipes]|uniref:NADPH oxidase organizer 1 n=1 Tax=Antechinus flavipes TaxID=38775 RepID=UPI002236A3B2|nr:NADPH oxidase organizer 1 [Antechinus flavipes]